jgi:hypothetical protein
MCCTICGSEKHTTGEHRGADMEAKESIPLKSYDRKNIPEWWLEESRAYMKKPIEVTMFPAQESCMIHTQEGPVKATKGDMIAWDCEGFPYPIKKSVFDKTYDLCH